MSISHRGYAIEKRNGKYVAKADELEIASGYMPRLLQAIDAFWAVTSQITEAKIRVGDIMAPRWLREWVEDPAEYVDLDSSYALGAC